MDTKQFIIGQLNRVQGPKKIAGSWLMIVCPFHKDSDPSCGIRIDGDKIGLFNCLGCGKKGSYNTIAKQLGLSTIDLESTGQTAQYGYIDLPTVEPDIITLQDLAGKNSFILEVTEDWRSIDKDLLAKIGAKMILDNTKGYYNILLPVYINSSLVGGIKGVLDDTKSSLKYINTPGPWSRKYGLFPYDYTAKLLETEDKVVFLTEGPRDSLYLLQNGIPALSILGGKLWSESKRELVLALEPNKVVIAMDSDTQGVKSTNMIYRDLKGKVELSILNLKKVAEKYQLQKVDPASLPKSVLSALKSKYSINP